MPGRVRVQAGGLCARPALRGGHGTLKEAGRRTDWRRPSRRRNGLGSRCLGLDDMDSKRNTKESSWIFCDADGRLPP